MSLKRFSLRALLIAVTAICVVLGYGANWKWQREQFHKEQLHKLFPNYEPVDRTEMDLMFFGASNDEVCYAPLVLRLLGEEGRRNAHIVIPSSDTRLVASGEYSQLVTSNNQPDYLRAKRLFPEARILMETDIDGKM